MDSPRTPSRAQSKLNFGKKCDGWLQRAEQQKLLAREMVNRMREMHRRAVEMRHPPHVFWTEHPFRDAGQFQR
jgi:hypothetical protein